MPLPEISQTPPAPLIAAARDVSHGHTTPANEPAGSSDSPRAHVLVIDDDRGTCELVQLGLRRRGFEVTWRTNPREAVQLARDTTFDVILTDLRMSELSGIDVCEQVLGAKPEVPVVVVTGQGSMETAVSALRVGAYDYITKPVDLNLLTVSIERAVQHHRLREEVRRLRMAVMAEPEQGRLLGRSHAMQQIRELVSRVGAADASVLITGESGTGKELVAQEIHARSDRRNGPFIAINCAAVPATLLESELFGHARGAFTDARSARTGLFVDASNGTLFLDEIGEMPTELQPKLLRALQERKVRPVGGHGEVAFDARIVASTNRDLDKEVAERRFRQDLFYRINVVRIPMPPLRERGSDVLMLAQHFVDRFARVTGKNVEGLTTPAAERLVRYDWPGNVRELENCIERAVTLTRFDRIVVEDLPDRIRTHRGAPPIPNAVRPDELLPVSELEKRYVYHVLELVGGNKSRAAEILGFDRRTLYRKLARYEHS